jgi:predicted Zn-dependent protease
VPCSSGRMKSIKTRATTVLMIVALLATSSHGFAPQTADSISWVPPSPRHTKTPFAPKPHAGDNIFKGEGEAWLADAILKLEVGFVMPIEDQLIREYVSAVGNNLAKHSGGRTRTYQFIPIYDLSRDAVSLAAGRIYISRGLLEILENEDELAAVLAHEMAHDAFLHTPKTLTRQLFWMTGTKKVGSSDEVKAALINLSLGYDGNRFAAMGERILGISRLDELEADRAAFYTLYKAGYNPRAIASVLRRLQALRKKQDEDSNQMRRFLLLLVGSHPTTAQRVAAVSWESIFLKMPPKDVRRASPIFEAFRNRVSSLPK